MGSEMKAHKTMIHEDCSTTRPGKTVASICEAAVNASACYTKYEVAYSICNLLLGFLKHKPSAEPFHAK